MISVSMEVVYLISNIILIIQLFWESLKELFPIWRCCLPCCDLLCLFILIHTSILFIFIQYINYHYSYLSFSFFLLSLEPTSFSLNLLIIIDNPLKLLHLNLILLQLAGKLINNSNKHNKDPKKLNKSGLMRVVYNTNENSEYFASSNNKWNNMLFKLFNHPIYKELTKAT